MSNNAFGLGQRTHSQWAQNNSKIDSQVIRGDSRLMYGVVTNVKASDHISQHYDVRLLDYNDLSGDPIILRSCKRLVPQASFDGVGMFYPMEDGDPVALLCKNGKMEDAVIIGSFYTNGDYIKYFREGQGDKPFTLHPGVFNQHKVAAQASVHPSRIAQPDAWFHIVGGKNVATEFDDPMYHRGLEGKRKASPQIASIEIKNKVGDVVQYSAGSQIYYADAEILILTNADGSSRCARLNDQAAYYNSLIERITEYLGIETEGGEAPIGKEVKPKEGAGLSISLDRPIIDIPSPSQEREDPSGIASPATGNKPIGGRLFVEGIDTDRSNPLGVDFNQWAPTQYHLDEAHKLAKMYREAAQKCIQGSMMTTQVANAMTNYNSEAEQTTLSANCKIEQGSVGSTSYGQRASGTPPMIFVIHETACSLETALAAMTDASKKVSYHGIITRDGRVIRLVPHAQRSFSCGISSFPSVKGRVNADNYYQRVGNEEVVFANGNRGSVNDFSINYSLVTADGVGNEDSTPGYTREQYQCLAEVIRNSGVPANRVTTHGNVDITGDRRDPRSLSITALNRYLARAGYNGQVNFNVVGSPIDPGDPDPSNAPTTTPGNSNIFISSNQEEAPGE